MRARKRLMKIREWIHKNKITTREECKKYVAEDWRSSLNAQVGGGDEDGEE